MTALECDGHNLKRSRKDEFVIRGKDVGEIERITIDHDNRGCALAQVHICNRTTGGFPFSYVCAAP
jgi:hypothetical protein